RSRAYAWPAPVPKRVRRWPNARDGIDVGERGGEFGGVLDRIGDGDVPAREAEQLETVFMDAIAGQHFHSHAPWMRGRAESHGQPGGAWAPRTRRDGTVVPVRVVLRLS